MRSLNQSTRYFEPAVPTGPSAFLPKSSIVRQYLLERMVARLRWSSFCHLMPSRFLVPYEACRHTHYRRDIRALSHSVRQVSFVRFPVREYHREVRYFRVYQSQIAKVRELLTISLPVDERRQICIRVILENIVQDFQSH